jgi:hypothetical protein
MAAAVVLLAFGALTALLSLDLPLGTLRAPDSGFFPLALGLMLVALAAGHIVKLRLASRTTQAGNEPRSGTETEANRGTAMRHVVPFIAAVVIATALLQPLGYALVVFLLMCGLLEILGMRPRGLSVVIAIVTAGVCQVLFVHWLRIPLPTGWLWH